MAYLSLADAFAGGTIQCVSFPTVNVFDPVAEAISGSAVAPKDDWAVRLARHPRLGGGPLLVGGKVVGVQLATRDADMAQVPAATLADLKKFLGAKAAPGGTADPAAVDDAVDGGEGEGELRTNKSQDSITDSKQNPKKRKEEKLGTPARRIAAQSFRALLLFCFSVARSLDSAIEIFT
jgi:hypothetical protein